ncbi:Ig-like domain repeat protein [Natrinema amylolyticum]|uniref:Ig-like domain repeat protein n=1 Tax=Natrinema amylolyticum TaxID=2878679 RepID=UPI001CF95B90|nr:Ig-like domain repeat protein [Natrinema amylolyticum]
MSDSHASSVVFVAVLLVLASGGVGVVAGTATASPAAVAAEPAVETSQSRLLFQADDDPDDNVTRRHRDPREYDEDGDLEALESRLMTRMIDDLEAGAVSLEDGEYERAARSVDESYYDSLGRYAEIADDTGGENYDELFELAGENQERIVEAARRYNETSAEYERARAAGDEGRARSLARELETIATSVNESSHELRANYDDLEAETDANLSESDAAIEAVNEEIQAEQATVRETEFVATDLTVDADRESISFREPLTATGRLRTATGRPVGSETIRLEVGNGSVRTETAADGSFAFEYRSTAEPLSTERLSIEYVPANESIYLGSETAVDVSIEQVEPTVSALETPTETAYGETATVGGELRVDGTPVDGVPLAVTLGDERIGRTETADGSFETAVEVPASVADGERELGVRLDYEDRALAGTAATNDVTVRETGVDVTVSASRVGDTGRTVAVDGTLETADGATIAGRSVRLDADGTTLETVTTDDDGSFAATVEIPDEAARGDGEIVAVHDGSGSNLASDTATSTVTFSSDGRSWVGLPAWAWLGVGGGLIVLLGAAAIRRWSRLGSSRASPSASAGEATTDAATGRIAERSGTEIAESVLEQGRDSLSRGRPERAVELAYAAVRHALSDRIDASASSAALTHWEFYRRWVDRRDDEPDDDGRSDRALLRTVTERYERATFDVADVSAAEAERVLDGGAQLCDRYADGDGGTRSETDDR